MPNFEKFVEIAIQNGFLLRDGKIDECLLLKKELWVCAGRGLGWKGKYQHTYHDSFGSDTPYEYPAWLEKKHRFIDHIAANKDAESFFKELIEKK